MPDKPPQPSIAALRARVAVERQGLLDSLDGLTEEVGGLSDLARLKAGVARKRGKQAGAGTGGSLASMMALRVVTKTVTKRISRKAADRATQKAVEKAVEKALAKAAEKPL